MWCAYKGVSLWRCLGEAIAEVVMAARTYQDLGGGCPHRDRWVALSIAEGEIRARRDAGPPSRTCPPKPTGESP